MRLWLALFFCLLATPAAALDPCNAQVLRHYQPLAQRYESGLLFKVEKCGLKPSYLFGTIHSDDPAIAQAVQEAFETVKRSRHAGFEYIMTPEAAMRAQSAMFNPSNQRVGLKAQLGQEKFALLMSLLNKLGPHDPTVVDRMKPWAAAVALQMPPSKTEQGTVLDEQLQHTASEYNVNLFGLETPEEQFSIFNSLSTPQQLAILEEAMADQPTMENLNDQLDKSYVRKDIDAIATLGKQAFTEISDPALRRYMEERLLLNRNRIMVERMEPKLKAGNSFIAVGALHLPAENGIIQLLEQRGYLVTAVTR